VADADGVTEATALTDGAGVPDAAGVAEGATLADAWGETEAVGAAAVFAVGGTAALRTSFSRTPTRRSALCLAVNTVRRRVTPKKMQPR